MIISSYSTALSMVWVEPQFDNNLSQKQPFFRLWEFLENSRCPQGVSLKNFFAQLDEFYQMV